MNDLEITTDELKSLIDSCSTPTDLTIEQLQLALKILAISYLYSKIDVPLFGPETDNALDSEFGFNNHIFCTQLKTPIQKLRDINLIPASQQ